ncbi:MAG: fused MFS/spermidine synthase, partial [Salinivirgaceae bacterium]|nr:fused MFS/spermidine synthase [Salinivirgaceae bacterium]
NLLGATVIASTLTLSVFMGGYGIGSLFFGNKLPKQKNKHRFFGVIVFLIGLFGLLSYSLIHYILPQLYPTFHTLNFAPGFINTVIYALAILFLFLPSFMVGGVLPIATKLITVMEQDIPKNVGHIYALDTFGSAIGGILTGFVLNRYIGQMESVIIGSLLMVVLGTVLVFRSENQESNHVEQMNALPSKLDKETYTLLMAALIFGFGMNGLQTILIRIFKTYLINAVYSFTIITSLVIFGFFIGSWIYKTRSQKKTYTKTVLINTLLFFALLALSTLFLAKQIPQLIMFPLGEIIDNEIFRIIGIPIVVSIISILPLAMISGFAFPMICALTSSKISSLSKNLGQTVMFNTIGSVLGPIIIGFILIPTMGVSNSIITIAAIISATTLIFILMDRGTRKLKIQFVLSTLIIVFVVGLVSNQYRVYILPPSFIKANRHIKAYKENLEGTYVVGEEIQKNNRILTTFVNNSAVIGTSYDAIKVVKMVGHLPFLLGLECKDALVVGFGIGVTTAAIGTHKAVQHIDCIELVSNLTDVAHFYKDINNNIHRDKRVTLFEDDGRHFLQITNKKYDLISSDPTHPILGSGSLYTKEYFELCKKRLTEKGMVSQYLPLHKLRLIDLMGIIKTFNTVFPNSSVWIGHFHAVLLGSMQPHTIDFEQWVKNMEKSSDDVLFYNNPYHIASSFLLDSEEIKRLTVNHKVNTDNIAYTDYFSFESLKEENIAINLQFLHDNRNGQYRQFSNIPDVKLMERFIKGNKYLTQGLVHMLRNNWQGLFSNIEKACMVNPENVEYPLLLEFYERANPSKTR